MTTIHVPDSGVNLTVEDLERLPKVEGYEYELDEGRLRIMAAAAMRSWHGEMALRVANWFRAKGQPAFPEGGVVLKDGTTRTPDVCVFWSRPESSDKAYYPAHSYAALIEIVSPDSADADRFEKPRLYAAAGVPTYWLVEPHPEDKWDAMVQIFQLGTAGYTVTRTVPMSELEREH
ncbi:Uma2 family endonuclease [Micromonospora sp. CPCC 205371]|nr:Uma2 family endonuclease [Micromonospora sp. CPCC 205371]